MCVKGVHVRGMFERERGSERDREREREREREEQCVRERGAV